MVPFLASEMTSRSELHELWITTYKILEFETASDDIFDWDLDVCIALPEYLVEIQVLMEGLKVEGPRFCAATFDMTEERSG